MAKQSKDRAMQLVDLTSQCRADLGTGVAVEDLRKGFCAICRQPKCGHAKFGNSEWLRRILTQEDRLFKGARIADESHPLWQLINKMDFQDMARQAIRMEIADRKGDWTIPDDSEIELFSREVAPFLGPVIPETIPPPKPTEPDAPEARTDPSTSTPIVAPTVTEPTGSVEEASQKRVDHLPLRQNIPIPAEGIMVGGAPVPSRHHVPNDPGADLRRKVQAAWGSGGGSNVRRVEPGTTIRLGVKKKDG